MKLTAAFVAAALTASRVRGLPIADSGANLIAARSDVKLDGGVMLQAAKRGTDTDLVTRQIDQAQQVFLARDVVQPDSLSKRAPGGVFGKPGQAGDIAHDLVDVGSPHSVGLPDLGLTDSTGAESSAATSGQLLKSPMQSTAEQARENTDALTTVKQLGRQKVIDLNTAFAIEKIWTSAPVHPIAKEALKEHASRYDLHHAAHLRAKGIEPWSDDKAKEERAKEFLGKTEVTPTSTAKDILWHQAREGVTLHAVTSLGKLYKLSKSTRQNLYEAEKQSRQRLDGMKKRLQHISQKSLSPA